MFYIFFCLFAVSHILKFFVYVSFLFSRRQHVDVRKRTGEQESVQKRRRPAV